MSVCLSVGLSVTAYEADLGTTTQTQGELDRRAQVQRLIGLLRSSKGDEASHVVDESIAGAAAAGGGDDAAA